jgi:hypothetical protein
MQLVLVVKLGIAGLVTVKNGIIKLVVWGLDDAQTNERGCERVAEAMRWSSK